MKKILLVVLLIFAMTSIASAAQVTFTWSPSPSVDVAGYRLFLKNKADGKLTKLGTDFMGKSTSQGIVTINDVEGLGQYTAVAKSFDLAGNESLESNEATKDGVIYVWKDTTPPAPPSLLQAISGLTAAIDNLASAISNRIASR